MQAELHPQSASIVEAGLSGLASEKHHTPKQLAELWGLSENSVRNLFAAEPGVIRFGEPSRRVGRSLRRRYCSLRIPASVAERVHRRLTGNDKQQRRSAAIN